MKRISPVIKNLTRKSGRTTALVLLTALLALAIFGGSIVILSLRGGLNSLENRLGADVIVVPSTARSKTNLEQILLQGTTGYFYMDREKLDKIIATDGVESVSAQLFLASLRASCCSVPVQVIGFDQATDFTVRPWITESYSRTLNEKEVAVGCRVSAGIGESIRIYGVNCPVVARLAETGTGLDTAVYCSQETLQLLLDAARDLGHDLKISGSSENVISAVYIKVRDDYDAQKVADDINIHIRKVEAVSTKSMLTGVSDSLKAVSGTITCLIIALWILALVILFIVFAMMVNERRRELAVYRLLGMSRKMLSSMILKEALLCSLAGALCGVALGSALVFPFTTLIEQSLKLPYLTPAAGTIVLCAALALAVTVISGSAASLRTARKLSRVDPGTTLREGA
ncbi:MAG: ABC transporter permease [Clostridia bacterium]|nr:ABC transporter permease [Clostridia bacterium]